MAPKPSPTTLMLGNRTHIYEDHEYDFSLPGEDEIPTFRILMHETHEERGAIWTRLSVHTLDASGSMARYPMYGPVRVNLMRSDRGGMLGIIEQLGDQFGYIDWAPMIDTAKILTIQQLEEELPVVSLARAATVDTGPPFLIYPFVARAGVSVLYGDGGTGKSTLALAMGIEVSTGINLISPRPPLVRGTVLYADYEDDDTQHAARVAAICRAHNIPLDGVDIMHTPLVRKVVIEAKRLRKLVHDTGAVLVILDSIGMGRGGDAVASEDTIRMFRALRSLEAPVLAIDHISKNGKSSRSLSPDPYGSIYTRNSARMMWFVEGRQSPLADPWDYLVFTHTKANHVKRAPNQYLKLKYLNAGHETDYEDVQVLHSLRFELTNVHGVPSADAAPEGTSGAITLLDEIEGHLWIEGASTVKQLAAIFSKSEDTIRKTCNRGVQEGKLRKDIIDGTNVYSRVTDDDSPWS